MSTYTNVLKSIPPYKFDLVENYIYIYHIGYDKETNEVGQFVILPTWPESLTDQMNSAFAQSTPLSRSAPIFSYSNSGPRTLTINLKFHREMMT